MRAEAKSGFKEVAFAAALHSILLAAPAALFWELRDGQAGLSIRGVVQAWPFVFIGLLSGISVLWALAGRVPHLVAYIGAGTAGGTLVSLVYVVGTQLLGFPATDSIMVDLGAIFSIAMVAAGIALVMPAII